MYSSYFWHAVLYLLLIYVPENLLQILVKEMDVYSSTLEEVADKGKKQVERYAHKVPGFENTIKAQLSNLQDSYNSLLETAHQIKVGV
jgi:nesprin-1